MKPCGSCFIVVGVCRLSVPAIRCVGGPCRFTPRLVGWCHFMGFRPVASRQPAIEGIISAIFALELFSLCCRTSLTGPATPPAAPAPPGYNRAAVIGGAHHRRQAPQCAVARATPRSSRRTCKVRRDGSRTRFQCRRGAAFEALATAINPPAVLQAEQNSLRAPKRRSTGQAMPVSDFGPLPGHPDGSSLQSRAVRLRWVTRGSPRPASP